MEYPRRCISVTEDLGLVGRRRDSALGFGMISHQESRQCGLVARHHVCLESATRGDAEVVGMSLPRVTSLVRVKPDIKGTEIHQPHPMHQTAQPHWCHIQVLKDRGIINFYV